jgi:hypothetical protein
VHAPPPAEDHVSSRARYVISIRRATVDRDTGQAARRASRARLQPANAVTIYAVPPAVSPAGFEPALTAPERVAVCGPDQPKRVRVHPVRGRIEAMVTQRSGCWQVDHAVGGEAGAEQVVERDGEEGDAEQGIAVERPSSGGSMGMAGQLVPRVGAAPDQDRRFRERRLGAQPEALLDPVARHPPRLASDRGRPWQAAVQRLWVPPCRRRDAATALTT